MSSPATTPAAPRRFMAVWVGFAFLLVACSGGTLGPITSSIPATTTSGSVTEPTSDAPAATSTIPIPAVTTVGTLSPEALVVVAYPTPPGSRPHDVAPAFDGGVWFTAQGTGELGWLDPDTGQTRLMPLGAGSRPHGVIVDRSGTPWITDGGLDAIVSVDPDTYQVTTYALPGNTADANLNTATFGSDGLLWFTGQNGIFGSLDPRSGVISVFPAPGGRGPYGITTTPDGDVYYASLAGSHIALIGDDGTATMLEPPTAGQGARRVWSDSAGGVWVSEWNSGHLSRYQPDTGIWATWRLPGEDPAAYAVFVDGEDIVWASDFTANALVRFDPVIERFDVYPLPHDPGEVRQLHGRPGEVWGAESAADHLVLIKTR